MPHHVTYLIAYMCDWELTQVHLHVLAMYYNYTIHFIFSVLDPDVAAIMNSCIKLHNLMTGAHMFISSS